MTAASTRPDGPRDPAHLPMTDASQVGEARRLVSVVVERLGFSTTRQGEASIVVTEAGNNLVRHARGGELVIRSMQRAARGAGAGGAGRDEVGIEVLAIDRGPGIANVARAIRDGYSTGGTPGTGLGAIRRLSDEFDLYSGPAAAGTVLMSRLWQTSAAPGLPVPGAALSAAIEPRLDVGVICLPKAGEDACGDAWALEHTGAGRVMILVADGLGHGMAAAQASRAAVAAFRANLGLGPAKILQAVHDALRSTRGAAAAVAELSTRRREIVFAGVGNIAGVILSPDRTAARSLVSHNGTLGAEARRYQEFVYPCPAGSLLVMHSDGLGSQWQFDRYPGLANRHPAMVAAVLYRDFRRTRDDVTVLAVRDAVTPVAPGDAGMS